MIWSERGYRIRVLALGDHAHAAQRIGMTDSRHGDPAVEETSHTIPGDAAMLATPRQRALPEPSYLKPKQLQRRCVHGLLVLSVVSTNCRLQPLVHSRDGFGHANRLPEHRVHSVASLIYAVVRKGEKVERLRFSFSTSLPVIDCKRTKFQQLSFLGMQLQVELPHSLGEFRPKLVGIQFPWDTKHDIIRKTHYDHFAVAPHDSGPMWVATSHSCDFFIHYASPV